LKAKYSASTHSGIGIVVDVVDVLLVVVELVVVLLVVLLVLVDVLLVLVLELLVVVLELVVLDGSVVVVVLVEVVVVVVTSYSYSTVTVAMTSATPTVRHLAGPKTLTSTAPFTVNATVPVPTKRASVAPSVTTVELSSASARVNDTDASGASVEDDESRIDVLRATEPGPSKLAELSKSTVVNFGVSVRLKTSASTDPSRCALTVSDVSVPSVASN
jgi:hypothetical protein